MQQQLATMGLKALVDDVKETPNQEVFRIGDLAKEFDITLRALRFYEDRGLLQPERSGSTRLYSLDDRQRLKLILLSKRVGFSLVEIQEILNAHDSKGSVADVLIKFKGQVSVLTEQKDEAERALLELSDTIKYLEDIA